MSTVYSVVRLLLCIRNNFIVVSRHLRTQREGGQIKGFVRPSPFGRGHARRPEASQLFGQTVKGTWGNSRLHPSLDHRRRKALFLRERLTL